MDYILLFNFHQESCRKKQKKKEEKISQNLETEVKILLNESQKFCSPLNGGQPQQSNFTNC